MSSVKIVFKASNKCGSASLLFKRAVSMFKITGIQDGIVLSVSQRMCLVEEGCRCEERQLVELFW